MRSRIFAVPRSRPLVLAIIATSCAAALVLFVQHRTLATLHSQTRTILQQVAQQTAGDIVFEARRALDGPVIDTLTAVNHPELRAGRLDLVAAEFETALVEYPHVERFFVWTADTERVAPGQVLFRSRDGSLAEGTRLVLVRSAPDLGAVSLERDPTLGTAIVELAHLEFEAVDLGTLVRETVAAFERSLEGRQFCFPLEEVGPAPSVMADPAALEQALVNLLDNAVKYGGEDRTVRVCLRSSANAAMIEVIDHGIGIAPEELDRIFDRFHRGAGRPPNRQGFGLGLSIVQELARAHGGRVEVESEVGKGSTFRVVLPARAAGRAWTDRSAKGDPGHGEAA